MTGTSYLQQYHIGRFFLAALISIALIMPQAVVPAAAASERAIYLYYTHTKETARIVFKRNGQFVQSGLNELNYFLRDWRRNEPTNPGDTPKRCESTSWRKTLPWRRYRFCFHV